MILTHLALHSFFEGATEAEAPTTSAGLPLSALYAMFDGFTEAEPTPEPEVEARTAGGIPVRRRFRQSWPRLVIIDGRRILARSPQELREMLDEWAARLEADAEAATTARERQKISRARRRVVIVRRLADDALAELETVIRAEDREIVLLLSGAF